jgi:diaminopimelate epimerase
MMVEMRIDFAKGHGTGNDFVIVPDVDDALDLSAAEVSALCDRRRGLGADGLLRVVRGADGEWFMDYRNADGSLAEMCGNGARVYARYLVESGLEAGPRVAIQTRAGRVVAEVGEHDVSITMPQPRVGGPGVAQAGGVDFKGTGATCGNPNLVCWVDDPSGLDLSRGVTLDPEAFPAGANVEFVAPVGPDHVRMRVVERGVGETLSCGSGACATAAVVLADAGRAEGMVTVDVPGGRLVVTLAPDRCVLTGPAEIVATGTFFSR